MKKLNGCIIKIYNRLISTRFLNKNNKVCRRLRAVFFHNICWECRAEFGKKNADRLFYLIRSPQSELGFFGLFNFVVDGIIDAVNIGAEPVVDWQYYPNDYLTDDIKVGKQNAWEFFFEPMSGVQLEELYQSKNVIMSNGKYLGGGKVADEYKHMEKMEETSKLIHKYVVLNQLTENLLEEEYARLGMDRYRVLGVKCRGTDFKETKPLYHAICPDVEYTAQIISEKEETWGKFDKIFLVTEDETMFEEMKTIYGDRLISNETKRIKTANGKWLNSIFGNATGDYKYQSMLEYLLSVYLLARCDALIAPVVGATHGAMRIRGKFDHYHLIEMGQYQ